LEHHSFRFNQVGQHMHYGPLSRRDLVPELVGRQGPQLFIPGIDGFIQLIQLPEE
jgi:hypothetical protein